MKRFRTVLFWAHLVCGTTAGLVILLMCVTGTALTYQRQIQYWADTHAFRAAPPVGATAPPIADLVAAARTVEPAATPSTVTLRADPSFPAAVAIGTRTIYVNPYTAGVYGEGRGQGVQFFTSMTTWHRYLGTTMEHRVAGRAITGASNVVFLFIVLSGMYLWWPRSLTWRQVRNVVWFRRGQPVKARHFNWHNVAGFWSAAVLAVLVGSGLVLSYPWANNLVYRVMGEEPPAPAGGRADVARVAPGQTVGASDLDVFFDRARQFDPEAKIITLRLPTSASAPVTVTLDRGDGGQPQLRGTLTLDAYSGDVVKWDGFSSMTPGRRLRSLLRFAHTGEVAGLPGQTLAGFASACGALLVYTGLSLSVRRFLKWKKASGVFSR